MKGRLISLVKDYATNKWHLTVSFDDNEIMSIFESLKDAICSIDIKKWFDKRSLNANALYWKMCGALAVKLKVSKPEMHNTLLRRYGADASIGGKLAYLVFADNDETEQTMMNAETFHVRPTSQVKEGVDGVMYRTWIMLKGSHELDTAEMSRLIDGVLGECKEQGIPTESPEEIERIKALWNQ